MPCVVITHSSIKSNLSFPPRARSAIPLLCHRDTPELSGHQRRCVCPTAMLPSDVPFSYPPHPAQIWDFRVCSPLSPCDLPQPWRELPPRTCRSLWLKAHARICGTGTANFRGKHVSPKPAEGIFCGIHRLFHVSIREEHNYQLRNCRK